MKCYLLYWILNMSYMHQSIQRSSLSRLAYQSRWLRFVGYWDRVGFSLLTQAMQHFSGINTIFYYSNKLVQGGKLQLSWSFGYLCAIIMVLRYGKKSLLLLWGTMVIVNIVIYWILFMPLNVTSTYKYSAAKYEMEYHNLRQSI